MHKVIFKNLASSMYVRDFINDRMSGVVEKFPHLTRHRLSSTVEMLNSPAHPGRDEFSVKLKISGPLFNSLIIEKAAPNLYRAAAAVIETLQEHLNRRIDRQRVRDRRAQRKFLAAYARRAGR